MAPADPRLIEIFLELATINGLSGHERPVADHVHAFLRRLGLAPREDNANEALGGTAGNVICDVSDGGEILLLAHMDTALPTAELKPIVSEDRIRSDGTTILGADNRSGMAVILYTVETLIRKKISTRPFTIVFPVCEETTMAGSKNLRLNGLPRMGFVFDSSLRPGSFIHSGYGAQTFRATIRGKAAHSGLEPERGINAVKIAARAIDRIPTGRINDTTTANIGVIHGGEAVNVVAANVLVEGEARSLDESGITATVEEIRQTFADEAERAGAGLSFAAEWSFKPYQLRPDTRVYRTIEEALRRAQLQPVPSVSAGGSDANWLNARGIPSVNIGIGAQKPHSTDEFILLEDLQKSAEIAAQLVTA